MAKIQSADETSMFIVVLVDKRCAQGMQLG